MTIRRRNLRFCVNPPIGKALAADALEGCYGALSVAATDRVAVVVTKVELVQVALQMIAGNVVIGSDQAALHDGEIALHAVGGDFPAHILPLGVVDLGVHGEGLLTLHGVIARAGIRHNVGVFVNLGLQHFLQVFPVHGRNVEGTDIPIALDKGNNLVHLLERSATTARSLGAVVLGAEVGFIGFNDFATTTQRASRIGLESLTDAVRHEPCGLVGHTQNPVQLVAAHALLGRAEQIDRLQPDIQLDLGTLKDCPNGHGKRFAAVTALVEAFAGRIPIKRVMLLAHNAAMRAYRAIRPADGFKVLAGLVGALEMGLVQVAAHS